jgi:ABC-2 type transport system ATP-binding protein
LLGRPPLLVLDEPTTGLDPAGRRLVWGVLKRARNEGASIIFSTHYMEEAESLGDRVAIISGGRLTAVGTVAELTARLSSANASLEDVYFELGGGRFIDLEPAPEMQGREAARGAWGPASKR